LQVAGVIARQLAPAAIDWVARDAFAPFVENCAIVRKVFVFNRSAGIKGLLDLRKQLKNAPRHDLVLDMQGLLRSGLMTRWANAPLKIGRRDARELSGFFYDKKIPFPPDKNAHAIDILMEFLPAIGAQKTECGELVFKKQSAPPAQPGYVALFPGSRREEKKWPAFKELTRRLLENGTRCLWAGSDGDAPENDVRELTAASPLFLNCLGKSRLDELTGLVGAASLVISNDSGPMHLAAAMRKNVLGIFGPTRSEQYGPYPLSRPSNAVICSPDSNLRSLSVEPVWELITSILASLSHTKEPRSDPM
jgi:ADP-heptose:LPS heptosyltransferase